MKKADAFSIGNEFMFCERVMYALTRQFVYKTVSRALEHTTYSDWHSNSYGALPCALDQFEQTWEELKEWGRFVLHRRALMATTEALIHFASSKKSSGKFDVHALELLKQINEVVYETLSHVMEDNPFDSDIEEGVASITQEYVSAFHNEWDDRVRPIFESWGKDS